MKKLTKIEKQIKRINSRIVQQVKTYGLNSQIVQTYIKDLIGQQGFVKEVPRKIGTDASGNGIYVTVPQIKTSKLFEPSIERSIRAFEAKKTPGGRIKETRKELTKLKRESKKATKEGKKDSKLSKYAEMSEEEILEKYDKAKDQIDSVLGEYYEYFSPEEMEDDKDISFLRNNSTAMSKVEFIQHYDKIKRRVAARKGWEKRKSKETDRRKVTLK